MEIQAYGQERQGCETTLYCYLIMRWVARTSGGYGVSTWTGKPRDGQAALAFLVYPKLGSRTGMIRYSLRALRYSWRALMYQGAGSWGSSPSWRGVEGVLGWVLSPTRRGGAPDEEKV